MLGLLTISCSTVKEKWEHLFRDEKSISAPSAPSTQSIGPTMIKDFQTLIKKLGLPEGIRASQISAIDLNNDQYTDLVILPDYYALPDFYLYNPKKGRWNLSSPRPLSPEMRASLMLFADLNKDGNQDLLIGGLNQKSELTPSPMAVYLGKIKKSKIEFKQASVIPLVPGPQSTAILFDYDLDGELDLFVGQWYRTQQSGENIPLPDQLYKGKKGVFTPMTHLLEANQALPTIAAQSCDINRDGYPDILTASTDGHSNRLWLNLPEKNGGRRFVDVGEKSSFAQDDRRSYGQLTGGRSFGLDCADFNGDGLVDIFSGELSYSYDMEDIDRSSILFAKADSSVELLKMRFIRQNLVDDLGIQTKAHAARAGKFIDFDFDGELDLIVDNSGFPPHTRLQIIKKNEKRIEDMAASWSSDILNPSSTVVIDLNRDGRPDLLSGQTSVRTGSDQRDLYPLINPNMANNTRYQIFLRGKKSAPQAWGAQLLLKTDQRTIYVENKSPFGGPAVQQEEGVWISLRPGERAQELHVRWPISPLKWAQLPIQEFLDESFHRLTICEPNVVVSGRKKRCRGN